MFKNDTSPLPLLAPQARTQEEITRPEVFIVIGICILSAILRLALHYGVAIHPDEAYYWTWSLRLDWSYYDVNPGIAYYIRFFTFLFGDSYLALKIAAACAIPCVLSCAYFSAREAGLSICNSSLVIIALTFLPALFIGSMLVTHDTGMISCWAASLYCSIRYIKRRETGVLYLLFFFIGLGALFKQMMIGFALGFGFWYLFWHRELRLLRSKHIWFGILLAASFLVPILIWNLQNDWAQIDGIVYHRASGGKAGFGKFFGDQAAAFTPFWYLALLGLLFFLVGQAIKSILYDIKKDLEKPKDYITCLKKLSLFHHFDSNANQKEQRMQAIWQWIWINAFSQNILFLSIAKTKAIQGNWLFPSYIAMFIILAAHVPVKKLNLSNTLPHTQQQHIFYRFFYKPLLWLGLVFSLLLCSYAYMTKDSLAMIGLRPHPHGILRNFTEGYQEIVNQVNLTRKRIDPKAGILSQNYQDAALAQWYLPEHEYVHALSIENRTQYTYWPQPKKGRNYFIFTSTKSIDEHPFHLTSNYKSMCAQVRYLGEHFTYQDNRALKGYYIWYCRDYQHHWPSIYLEKYQDEPSILLPNLSYKMRENWQSKSIKKNQERKAKQPSPYIQCQQRKDKIIWWKRLQAKWKHGRPGVCFDLYEKQKTLK